MTINPFEPPRAVQETTAPAPGGAASEVTEEAVAELVKSAPWARWAGRLALASGGASVMEVGTRVWKGHAEPNLPLELLSVVVSVGASAALWILARRYTVDADRLRTEGDQALSAVIGTQHKLFKVTGIFWLLGVAVMVLAIAT